MQNESVQFRKRKSPLVASEERTVSGRKGRKTNCDAFYPSLPHPEMVQAGRIQSLPTLSITITITVRHEPKGIRAPLNQLVNAPTNPDLWPITLKHVGIKGLIYRFGKGLPRNAWDRQR